MLTEAELLPPKVLVVDANTRHCLLYRMEMEAQGYEVVCAHNGREALQQLQYRCFDVAVVDVILPDIKGDELIHQITTKPAARNGRRLPIIINTAYPYSKRQRRQWPADAFILKSSNLDELIGKVTSFLKKAARAVRV
jgi:CheY-like chemotaxis protein